jgi:hypothetical protein
VSVPRSPKLFYGNDAKQHRKHKRNKRVPVTIAASSNRTAVLRVSDKAYYVTRRAGSRRFPQVWPYFSVGGLGGSILAIPANQSVLPATKKTVTCHGCLNCDVNGKLTCHFRFEDATALNSSTAKSNP